MDTELSNVFEKRFHNQLEELSRVSAEAKQFLEQHGVSPYAIYVAELAMEEIGTNILKYAYRDSAIHEIRLRLELTPGLLQLILEDDGQPFDPVQAPVPDIGLPPAERMPGGLGIYLVRKLVQQMNYERGNGLNRLTLNVALSAEHSKKLDSK